MTLKEKLEILKYKLEHKALRWVQDEEGDLGLEILGVVTLVKYKEHTIVKWFKNYERAPKYVGNYVAYAAQHRGFSE